MEDTIKEMNKKRLFVDLDGTLAEFRKVDTLEKLYEKNYFLELKPHENVVAAIRNIKNNHPEIEAYILSAVLSDSKYALEEKNQWLDKYLPEITQEYRIFPPCGTDKKDYIAGGVGNTDYLLDDYSLNLNAWEPPARGIKLMNGINGNHGTWQSDRLGIDKSADELSANIVSIIKGDRHYQDMGPFQSSEGWKIESVNLSHDGYADVDIKVSEYQDGEIRSFVTNGRFRINDPENGACMKLLNVSNDIFEHPILHREWDKIEAAIKEKVLCEEALESYGLILSEATEAIIRQGNPWGAWFGRIANNERPEEYIDIDIEGIERTSQLIVNISFVNGNDFVSMGSCDFYIDAKSKENLDYVKKEALLSMHDYIATGLKGITYAKKGMTLYSPYSDNRIEEHYKLLSDRGISEFPEREKPAYQNNNRKGR